MTPEERTLLKDFGRTVLFTFVSVAPMALLHVIFTIPFCYSTSLGVKSNQPFFRKYILLTISIVSFTTSCIYTTASWSAIYLKLSAFSDNPGMLFINKGTAWKSEFNSLDMILDCVWIPLPFLAGMVMAWRGSTLFPRQRFGYILTFSSCVIGMIVTLIDRSFAARGRPVLAGSVRLLHAIGAVMSLVANLVTTGLIVYGIWSHKYFIVAQLHLDRRRQFRVHRVLLIIVKSGLFCGALQVLNVAVEFLSPSVPSESWRGFVGSVYHGIFVVTIGVYPSIIELLAKHEGNFVEAYSTHWW